MFKWLIRFIRVWCEPVLLFVFSKEIYCNFIPNYMHIKFFLKYEIKFIASNFIYKKIQADLNSCVQTFLFRDSWISAVVVMRPVMTTERLSHFWVAKFLSRCLILPNVPNRNWRTYLWTRTIYYCLNQQYFFPKLIILETRTHFPSFFKSAGLLSALWKRDHFISLL